MGISDFASEGRFYVDIARCFLWGGLIRHFPKAGMRTRSGEGQERFLSMGQKTVDQPKPKSTRGGLTPHIGMSVRESEGGEQASIGRTTVEMMADG